MRSARGDSEPFEVSVPLVDDVPFVALLLEFREPLFEALFVDEFVDVPL